MIRTPNSHPAKTPSTSDAKTEHRPESDPKPAAASKDGVQGEGNYVAAREFNAAERKFVASGKVAAAARAAAPKSEAERQAMFAAEEEGKRRAKEWDPAQPNVYSDQWGFCCRKSQLELLKRQLAERS